MADRSSAEANGLTFRLASHDDYEAVMRISEGIYYGTDYLPAYFHSYIDDPDIIVFLAAVGDQVPFIGYQCGPDLWWRQDPAQLAQLDTTGLPDVVPLQDADDDFCTAVQNCLPAEACGGYDGKPIILADWDPYTLCPANLKHLQAKYQLYTLEHKDATSLSIVCSYPTSVGQLFCFDIYARDFPTLQKHLLKHLQDASLSCRSGTLCARMFTGLFELEDSLHSFYREALQMSVLHEPGWRGVVFESEF